MLLLNYFFTVPPPNFTAPNFPPPGVPPFPPPSHFPPPTVDPPNLFVKPLPPEKMAPSFGFKPGLKFPNSDAQKPIVPDPGPPPPTFGGFGGHQNPPSESVPERSGFGGFGGAEKSKNTESGGEKPSFGGFGGVEKTNNPDSENPGPEKPVSSFGGFGAIGGAEKNKNPFGQVSGAGFGGQSSNPFSGETSNPFAKTPFFYRTYPLFYAKFGNIARVIFRPGNLYSLCSPGNQHYKIF